MLGVILYATPLVLLASVLTDLHTLTIQATMVGTTGHGRTPVETGIRVVLAANPVATFPETLGVALGVTVVGARPGAALTIGTKLVGPTRLHVAPLKASIPIVVTAFQESITGTLGGAWHVAFVEANDMAASHAVDVHDASLPEIALAGLSPVGARILIVFAAASNALESRAFRVATFAFGLARF